MKKETETIIYFYCRKHTGGADKRGKEKRRLSQRLFSLFTGEKKKLRERFRTHTKYALGVKLIFAELSYTKEELFQMKQEKAEQILERCCTDILKNESENEKEEEPVVWLEEELAAFLGKSERIYPASFLRALYETYVKNGELLIRDGAGARELLEMIKENLNMLLIFSEDLEDWEEWKETVYEETGLVVQLCHSGMGHDISLQKGKKYGVVMDFSGQSVKNWRILPENGIYLDLLPAKEKAHVISGKRKDITYHAYPKCLDT